MVRPLYDEMYSLYSSLYPATRTQMHALARVALRSRPLARSSARRRWPEDLPGDAERPRHLEGVQGPSQHGAHPEGFEPPTF